MNANTTIRELKSLEWHQLPADAGQIVDVTYATDEAYLYRSTHDQSDCSICIERAELDDDSEVGFEPQNGQLPDVAGDYETVVKSPSRDMVPAILEMAEVLDARGDRYTGGVVWDMASAWIEAGFAANDAADWMDAGFWDADAAATVRDMGLTADQARERADALADAEEDAAEVYTDGDPIYSICNGDTKASVLLTE